MTKKIPSLSELNIYFKCVDSMFFTKFDGDYEVTGMAPHFCNMYWMFDPEALCRFQLWNG